MKISITLILLLLPVALSAVTVSPAELAAARRWFSAKFEGKQTETMPLPGICVEANYGAVQCNARGGRPLNLRGVKYAHGLYCHAVSRLRVRLTEPVSAFSALVGVDTNDNTRSGQGSVLFKVMAGDQTLFDSGLLHEGDPVKDVRVKLTGRDEFVLVVEDGGDGHSCDQADWVDAKVELPDGKAIWLADLQMHHRPADVDLNPPFSFEYDGKPVDLMSDRWKRTNVAARIDDHRIGRTLTYTDSLTGLVVQCAADIDDQYPTVQWMTTIRNDGNKDTPIISNIKGLDARFTGDPGYSFMLHHNQGDNCAVDSFKPLDTQVEPNTALRFAPNGGRPSTGAWPYFNLEWNEGGVIIAVGWPGQWSAEFALNDSNALRLTAGQEVTHFVLHPGEEARTPLIALQFYSGTKARAQNVWRRWMFARTFPRPKDGLLKPGLTACSGWQFPGLKCNQQGEIQFISRYLEEGVKLDYWWMDAGWYPCGDSWANVGSWEVDKERYPNGLLAVTDFAHQKGMQCVVWFEPERVTPGTWLYEKHPEWLLGPDGGTKLLNLGNDKARTWLTNHIDHLITTQQIDLYRQDFNMDPLPYWRANDPPDRQGITENHHITGYLAYWDELRQRHPGMLIDSCASGGRRDDLETMRRAVPLLRSDYEFQPTGLQCHTYAFDQWLPFHDIGSRDIDPYSFRSCYSPMMGFVWDVRDKSLDYKLARKLVGEWRSVAPNFFGDFYPLTEYGTGDDIWLAWQLDRPEFGEGMVQAFRRPNCIYEAANLKLHGLDAEGKYRIRNVDRSGSKVATGSELMEKGLRVVIPQQPGAVVITYSKLE